MEAHPEFVERQRNSNDFLLVSRLDSPGPPTTTHAPLALAILLAMVLAVTFGWLSLFEAALLAGALLLVTRCCSEQTARNSIDWTVLLAIGASLSLGHALEASGAARTLAQLIASSSHASPWVALAIMSAVTMLVTEFVTNNAAAVIMFPLATTTASLLGASPMPFVMTVMVMASASFSSPLGYQTHLMVLGPGGYRLRDYVKLGAPLNLLIWGLVTALVPRIWPF